MTINMRYIICQVHWLSSSPLPSPSSSRSGWKWNYVNGTSTKHGSARKDVPLSTLSSIDSPSTRVSAILRSLPVSPHRDFAGKESEGPDSGQGSARFPIHYTILYYTVLYCTILYYTILCYAILYYTILYHTIYLGIASGGAGEQFLLLDCGAAARTKGVPFSQRPVFKGLFRSP